MITTRLHQVLVDINMTFFWTESLDHGVLFRFKLASLTIRTYRTGTLDRWVNMYIGCIFYSPVCAFLKIKNISVLMLMIMMAASAMNRHFSTRMIRQKLWNPQAVTTAPRTRNGILAFPTDWEAFRANPLKIMRIHINRVDTGSCRGIWLQDSKKCFLSSSISQVMDLLNNLT